MGGFRLIISVQDLLHEQLGQPGQKSSDHFQGEENEDSHPVEEVGHDGSCEAEPVLVPLLDVVESDHGRGETRPDVRPHHHWDPLN